MPEGPELRMNSMFINHVCRDLVFAGPPRKSEVSKSDGVLWDSPRYSIASESRGKEMALLLQCLHNKKNKMRILFRFGMSGKFAFTPASMIPKHAHLRFHAQEEAENAESTKDKGVLSFVDTRRFGSWHVMDSGWGDARGPDIVDEYSAFRSNVLCNLEDPAFRKPMCEVMLNQKYFNGVGNYLRAEVLFRAKIPPFIRARDALQPMVDESLSTSQNDPDILQLCRDVSQEVISLKRDLGKHELMTASVSESDHEVFLKWLRCYNNPAMSIMKDKNGRTVWFQGEAGPLAPKGGKVKAGKRSRAPDNPNPTSTSVKEELQEAHSQETPLVEETAVALKTEPGPPVKKSKVTQQRKSKRKVKPLKKLRKTDDKETKLEEKSTIIPSELLRRSARLKRETEQGHS